MPHYRLYFMSPTGHIDRSENLHAPDNAKAVAMASIRSGPQPMELWESGRRVRRFGAAANDRHIVQVEAAE